MGSAADALTDLTGVKPATKPSAAQKLNLSHEDTGSAANALRSLYGIDPPANFADRFAPAEEQPFKRADLDQLRQPKPDTFGRMYIDLTNTQMAAGQRTSPHTEAYRKMVSNKVYENDAGEILYPDPATGNLVRTDSNKQVVLRDPADGRLKVYERSDLTNEGVLSSAGRMLGTGMAAGAPTSKVYQAVAAPSERVIGAAERLSETGSKVTVPRAIASDNPAVQEAGAIVRNIPIANAPLTKAAETTISQIGTKAGEIAGKFGGSASADSAGNVARSIRDWITKGSRAKEEALYDKVDNLINPNAKGTLDSATRIASSINTEREAAALGASPAVKQIQSALDRGGLTYDGVKKLRTSIGEQLDSGILPEGTSKAELKRIYGALTEDLKATVEASGRKPALDAFERANRYSRLANDRRESLAKIVGSHGDAPAEAVFDKLKAMAGSSSRADIGRLAQARKAMGSDDWNEVASTIVSRLGRDIENNFSPRRFLTEYGKLSPAGKNLLFRSGGKSSLANSLDDIAAISSRFKDLEKYANPSGTSRSVIGSLVAYSMGVEPLTMAQSVLGGHVLASVLASPAGASSLAKWTRANLLFAESPTPARMAAFKNASHNLISTTGANVSVSDFLKALQSPVTTRADQQEVPGQPRQ